MSYAIKWQVEKRVVVVTYRDAITVEDLRGVNEDLQTYYDTGEAPIHVISQVHTNVMPTNIKVIRELLSTLRLEGWGWFIVVGFDNALGRFLMTLVTNTFKLQAKAVDSIEDAMDVLYRADSTLDAPAGKQVRG